MESRTSSSTTSGLEYKNVICVLILIARVYMYVFIFDQKIYLKYKSNCVFFLLILSWLVAYPSSCT